MASRSQMLADQIKAGQAELIDLVSASRKEIELMILKYAEQGNFIKAAAVRDRLYKGISEEYVNLNGGLDDWTKQRSTVVAKEWHALAIDDLPTSKMTISEILKDIGITQKTETLTFGQFSEKYLNDIIGKINPSTMDKRVAINARLEGMLAEDVRAIRIAVSDTMRKGALTGMNYTEMSREMQKRASEIKPAFQFVDKAGKTWNSDSYFSMLNSTLHTTVARETYIDTAAEVGLDLMTIEGGPSSGPPGDPCDEWNGEIVSITGETKGYPTYQDALDAGVFHPNCRHTLSVYIPPKGEE